MLLYLDLPFLNSKEKRVLIFRGSIHNSIFRYNVGKYLRIMLGKTDIHKVLCQLFADGILSPSRHDSESPKDSTATP